MTAQKILFFSLIISFVTFLSFYYPYEAYKSDFISYYTAAAITREGNGEKLYNIETQKYYQKKITGFKEITLLPFRYLPFVSLFFLPFTLFPLAESFLLFSFLNIFLLIAFIVIAQKLFTGLRGIGVIAVLCFAYIPHLQTILLGQISLILSLIVLLIYAALKHKKYLLVGILCGLLLFKIQYIILTPFIFLLVKNKRLFFFGFFTSIGLLTLISLFIIGISGILGYPSFLVSTETQAFGSGDWRSYGLYSFINSIPFIRGNFYPVLLINTVAYLGVLFLYVNARKKKILEELYIFAVIATVLFSIHVLSQDLSILITPILILLGLASRVKNKKRIFLLIHASLLYSLFFFATIPEVFIGKVNWGPYVLIGVLWSGWRTRLGLNINLKLKNPTAVAKKDHIDRL